MPDISAWANLAADTVTVEPYVSQNKNGEAIYGTAVSYPAHIKGEIKRVTDLNGNERISSVQAYLIGAPVVTPRDRVTLPVRFVPRVPEVLAIGSRSDQYGPHHTVIYS